MKIILHDEKYDVIYKYSNVYIRFIGGQMMPIPCDVKITEEENAELIKGKRKVEEILFEYRGKIPWTEEEFMRRAFEDYFAYVYNMNKDAIKEMISKLNSNKALKNEMYISIMNEKFPEKCWAKVKGFTAREYSQNLGTDINITYMKMIEML